MGTARESVRAKIFQQGFRFAHDSEGYIPDSISILGLATEGAYQAKAESPNLTIWTSSRLYSIPPNIFPTVHVYTTYGTLIAGVVFASPTTAI